MSILPRDEGYVKFRQERIPSQALPEACWRGLEEARNLLYRAGLIGMYPDGIGYGNISWIPPSPTPQAALQFVISGTQTGHLEHLDGRHYVRVLRSDAASNSIYCEGPLDASSESMTHAAVYQALIEAGSGAEEPKADLPREPLSPQTCVLHVHHLAHWTRLLNLLPCTAGDVPYGTPAMAEEVGRLFKESELKNIGVFAMGGHEEGLVSFGASPQEALQRLRIWGILEE